MDNIKATNNCGIYLDEFCNRETLNINKKYKLEIIIKIAYDPNDKFYRYGIGCMHNSSSGWGFGYAPGKYLTCDSSGKPYNYSKYRTLWNRIMLQINAKHSTHDCRHTCATLMDNAEVNFNAKRRILGHSDGDVTDMVYTHKNLKQLRKAINKIK